ncbi:MAG: toll/interleukin-1 receptor domain-containing protein [Ktedonobacteraceae bacterium]|nr:toll/interleukin-1 receptor domain-containing protein [Ktedonobacteraceae bacterium]
MITPSAPTTTKTIDVFCLYAQEDEKMCAGIVRRILSLQRRGYINSLHTYKVNVGENGEEVDRYIDNASIILLLMSPDFIKTDYCYTEQMKRILERWHAGETRVYLVYLRPVAMSLRGTPFYKFTCMPFVIESLTNTWQWGTRQGAYFAVAAGLRRVIEEMKRQDEEEQEREEAYTGKSRPCWLPYERNPYFVGREKILAQLHSAFKGEKHPIWAKLDNIHSLTGPSDYGKTQIAVEYAHRYRSKYSAVLWANAHSRESLVRDYTYIARVLELPERDAPDYTVMISAVKQWLETHEDWLLILDDTQEPERVRDFLPLVSKGSILITTTSDALSTLAQGIAVSEMGIEEGALLLLRRAGLLALDAPLDSLPAPSIKEAQELVSLLAGHPLALDMAGAYITETGCSLAEYRRHYHVQEKKHFKRTHSLECSPIHLTTVLNLAELPSPAFDILRLCYALPSDAIPTEICPQTDRTPGLRTLSMEPVFTQEAVEVLYCYALLRRSVAGTFSIPTIVRSSVQQDINPSRYKAWAELTISAVYAIFPDPFKRIFWPLCDRSLHLLHPCVGLVNRYQVSTIYALNLFSRAGLYLRDRGEYAASEHLYWAGFNLLEQSFGPNDHILIGGLRILADLSKLQEHYDEAETLLQRALTICEKEHGTTVHADNALFLNDLAGVYEARGDHEGAKQLYEHALAINEQVLDPKHPDLAGNLHSLAKLYIQIDQYEQALPLLERAFAIYQQVLQPRDVRLAFVTTGLALCYGKLGCEDKMLAMLDRANDALKAITIPAEPDLGVKYTNIAAFYLEQGDQEAAQVLLEQGLILNQERLGPDHPEVARTLNNLASLYRKLGKEGLASELFERALAIVERYSEDGEISTNDINLNKASILNNMACFYRDHGHLSRAEQCFEHALALFEQVLGPEHPNVAVVLVNYAELLWLQRRRQNEAMRLEARALQIKAKHEQAPIEGLSPDV